MNRRRFIQGSSMVAIGAWLGNKMGGDGNATTELLSIPGFEDAFQRAARQVDNGKVVRFDDIRRNVVGDLQIPADAFILGAEWHLSESSYSFLTVRYMREEPLIGPVMLEMEVRGDAAYIRAQMEALGKVVDDRFRKVIAEELKHEI